MKLTVTIEEATEILRNYFFSKLAKSDIEVTIVNTGEHIVAILTREVDKAGIDIPANKIPRIKALRTASEEFWPDNDPDPEQKYMGLGDAKWAIENWSKFLEFVRNNGRLPKAGIVWATPNPLR